MRAIATLVRVASVIALAPTAWAACPWDEQVDRHVAVIRGSTLTEGFGSQLTQQEGLCAQAKIVRPPAADLGPAVGYKAGLTNAAMQKRISVDHPVRGLLLRDVLHRSGAQVPARFGARPLYEADFITVVKNDGLARATSLRQAAESISHIVPFMELPDLTVDPAATLTGPGIVAINVGTRLSVVGDPIPVQTDDTFIDALAAMTVSLSEDGVELQHGPGSAIMDHQLNWAVWLARDLEQAGIRLKPGDLLSLASFLPIKQPKPGTTTTVKYLGLPGDPVV